MQVTSSSRSQTCLQSIWLTFPNTLFTLSLQLDVKSQDHHYFKGHPCCIFPFFILSLSRSFLALCPSLLPRVPYMPLYPSEWSSWSKKSPLLLFHHFPTSPLVFHLSPSRVLGHCLCVVQAFCQCDRGITIQHQAHTVFCFVLFPRGCMHSSPCTACEAIVSALLLGNSWVKTYFCTLSGQLIMDFDYSHFVLLSAVPSPTGGPAERPAPLIVSVSGLIEPNGNGCCQSSLFSSVYMLIHQRDIHYRLAENSFRQAHTHTHTHTHSHFAVILIKGWSSQWSAAGPADATGN